MSIPSNVLRPQPAQTSADPYGALRNFDVLQTLGHGHFSVVYSARNRFTGVCVALKKVEVSLVKIHPVQSDRFRSRFLLSSVVWLMPKPLKTVNVRLVYYK